MNLNKDHIKLTIHTHFDLVPPQLKIKINNTEIFNNKAEKELILEHNEYLHDRFKITIEKSGKSKKLADKGNYQESIIDVSLNGLSQCCNKFGKFIIKNNPYIKDQTIQTNKLNLNGIWTLELPVFRQPFFKETGIMRDSYENTDIACFGCSFTYGNCLEKNETWPKKLEKMINVKIKNFGCNGNSISSIVGSALEYIENYKCNKIIFLLPHPCRLQVQDIEGNIYNLLPSRTSKVEKLFPDLIRNIVLYGEETILFAGYLDKFVQIINHIAKKADIFLSCYDKELYNILLSLKNCNFKMLPFFNRDKRYSLASDNIHPGPEHMEIFANDIVKYLNNQ